MKKLAAVLVGCFLTFNLAALTEIKEANQKWLDAVEKMVNQGEKHVSTHYEDRVELLTAWGHERGYAVRVTETENGYRLEVTGKEPAKAITRE